MKLVLITLIYLIVLPVQAQNIPNNAWSSGSNWYCNDGYKKQGNECIKFKVPQNAWVSGSSWYCNDGYKKQGNDCIKLRVPKNAWVSGASWYCNDGYKKQGNDCIKFRVPQNAWVSGSNWYCNDGYKKQDNSCVKLSAQEHAKLNYQIAKQRNSLSDGTIAYISKIDSDNGDIIKLENGGIVEISSYFGYLGYRKNVVLYGKGSVCNLWIEGKKSYKCSLIKSPNSKGEQAKLVHISEVKGNGSILKMLDGSIFEVDSFDEINSSLWLGISDAILINGSELFNFDEGDSVTVHKLK